MRFVLWREHQRARFWNVLRFQNTHPRAKRTAETSLWRLSEKWIYIQQELLSIYKRDPKFVQRVMKQLDFHPNLIDPVLGKLMKAKQELKGADLAKLLRFILKEDFNLDWTQKSISLWLKLKLSFPGITCSFDYLVSILSLLCKAIRSSKKDGSEKEKAQEKRTS